MKILLTFAFAFFALLRVNPAQADTGHANAFRVTVGSGTIPISTAITSYTVTTIKAFRLDQPETACFNNSNTPIFLSSAAASVAGLRAEGFIVLSSATFKLGAHLGAVTGMGDTAGGDVRCWQGRTTAE